MICIECNVGTATRKGVCHRCYQRKYMRGRRYARSPRSPETKAKQKIWRAKNREKIEAQEKLWKSRNREKILFFSAKHRAKARKLEFSISLSDIVIPSICPVLGIEITWRGNPRNSPSLDRLDSTKGYTPENVRVISWRANRLKCDASIEEMERILKYMKEDLDKDSHVLVCPKYGHPAETYNVTQR